MGITMLATAARRACTPALLARPLVAAIGPRHSCNARSLSQQAAMESHKFEETDAIRRRLIYRSKQRGWLELDIMLGDWSSENLKNLGEKELKEYEALLDQENPDLFKWLTGQLEAPEEIQGPVFKQLMQHVSDNM